MTKKQFALFALWGLSTVLFLFGISLPIATVEKFYFFDNEFSLIGSLITLAEEASLDSVLLLAVIFLFTFVFPIAKLVTLFLQILNLHRKWENRATKIVETIGHFSMVDVFVIALMVLMLKLDLLVKVYIHAGFYAFTASILLTIGLSMYLKKHRQELMQK